MHRWDIINHFITKYEYKSYLEIGYFKGWSFDNIKCDIKVAVDPNPSKTEYQEKMPHGAVDSEWSMDELGIPELNYDRRVIKLTSDEFFERLKKQRELSQREMKYDIIFIDGLHEAGQVLRDIQNSLLFLSERGTILLHDMNPPTWAHVTTGDAGGNWNGDCYKAILSYGAALPFMYYTIDTDWGVGVIRPFSRPHPDVMVPNMQINMADVDYTKATGDWDYFDRNRKELMNIISIEEFLKREAEHATA
jgi:hypothetical protein